jgi:hypothetical protein
MVAAAAMNRLAASGALIEQRERPAVARKIAQMAVEASRQLAPMVAATNYSVGMVVVQGLVGASRLPVMAVAQGQVEATHSPVASKAVVEANLQFVAAAVASRVVAAARDWPAVEVERSRSYRKSEHYQVDLLRSWRIVAYW